TTAPPPHDPPGDPDVPPHRPRRQPPLPSDPCRGRRAPRALPDAVPRLPDLRASHRDDADPDPLDLAPPGVTDPTTRRRSVSSPRRAYRSGAGARPPTR